MGKRELIAIRLAMFLLIYVNFQGAFAQKNYNIDVFGKENLRKFVMSNILLHPINNTDSVKYTGYYIKLTIKDDFVIGISYSENVPINIPRRASISLKDINEKISLKEFGFKNVELIIIPVLLYWAEINEESISLDQALSSILPNEIYGKSVYIIDPFVQKLYNPRR